MLYDQFSNYKDESNNLHSDICTKLGKRLPLAPIVQLFSDRNSFFFSNFVKRIADGKINYIVDFPLYLKSTKNVQIEVIFDEDIQETLIIDEDLQFEGDDEDQEPPEKNVLQVNMFMYNLIKYALNEDEKYSNVSEAALVSISKLLKLSSVQIIDLLLKTWVVVGKKITTFSYRLPSLVEKSNTINQKRALLRCIAALSGVMPTAMDIFTDFFIEQLQLSDPDFNSLRKTAASSASLIICTDPLSEFAKKTIEYLPFDIEDHELSKYCFKSLEALSNVGEFDCFDLPQIMKFTQYYEDRTAFDALCLLITAAFNSIKICQDLLQYLEDFEFLLHNMNPKKYICLLIINIVSKGEAFAAPFYTLIDLLSDLYFDCEIADKTYIVKTICNIILNDHSIFFDDESPVYDVLLDAINLDNDVIIIVIETLVNLNYDSEDFHQTLIDLTQAEDEVIGYFAESVLNRMDQSLSQENFPEY